MAYATTLDEVLALRSENAKLRAALEPFADVAKARPRTITGPQNSEMLLCIPIKIMDAAANAFKQSPREPT